jgi:hypothetical protein
VPSHVRYTIGGDPKGKTNEIDGIEASIICPIIRVATSLFLTYWLFHMLPGHRPILPSQMVEFQSRTRWLRYTMNPINVVLSLGGIIALWFMRPVATTFYAAQLVTSMVNAVVNTFFPLPLNSTSVRFTSQPNDEVTDSITVVLAAIFLLPFSAQKSHVKPQN